MPKKVKDDTSTGPGGGGPGGGGPGGGGGGGKGKNKNDTGGDTTNNILGTAQADYLDSGTSGVDNVTGSDGSDWIYTFEGADIIDAGGGDDLIVPGTGDNTIEGGDGVDTVLYDFLIDSYTISTFGDVTTVSYTVGSDSYTDTLTGVESVIINSSTTEVSSSYTVTFDNLGTDYGLYDANTAVGSGEVMLTSSGLYVLATVLDTSFLGIPSGGVEDASTRIVDQDGGGDTEFRISNDADAWGISEEVNIQSAFDFGFEVVSFTIEDLDAGEQVLLSLVQDDPVGGDYNDPDVWIYDITGLDGGDGTFTAAELSAADPNIDLTDVDQFILETNDGSTIYLDNLVIA